MTFFERFDANGEPLSSLEAEIEAKGTVSEFAVRMLQKDYDIVTTAQELRLFEIRRNDESPYPDHESVFYFIVPTRGYFFCVTGYGRRMQLHSVPKWHGAPIVNDREVKRHPWLVCKPQTDVELEDVTEEEDAIAAHFHWELSTTGNCGGGVTVYYDRETLERISAKW